jgi:hypothetical protein
VAAHEGKRIFAAGANARERRSRIMNPDAHTCDCVLACAKSGFGIVTKEQQFLKFDAAGDAKIANALEASSRTDHLRVNVNGDMQGDTLKMTSIQLL